MRIRIFFITLIPTFITLKLFISFLDIWFCLVLSLIISLLVSILSSDNLNTIKSATVGDNQHGSASFATDTEIEQYYDIVLKSQATKTGFVIGKSGDKYIVDTSDTSVTLLAPPGAGKTKCILIPTLYYNGQVNTNTKGKGASFIVTDLKGEELETTGTYMKNCGYRTPTLNFADPLKSANYNVLNSINQFIDTYKTSYDESEKILAYAKAERYAKALSEAIVDNVEGVSKNEAGQFFTDTAKGLVTGISLFVAEYAKPDERHIVSVFKLIIELNGLVETDEQGWAQKSKLAHLLETIDNDRIVNYVGPAMSADSRTSMNVFSSALSKLVAFIDAEFEQMICSHSPEFDASAFIENSTVIYIICPDENTSRHFFASLFIRFIMNDLIELSRNFPQGKLKRNVICLWDEFGNMPAVKNLDTLVTAARSRNIRFAFVLQSIAQLEKAYPGKMSNIVFDASQSILFTYVSPTAKETAEMLSKILGSKTIKSGSISTGSSYTVSHQMMARELLKPEEIMQIKQTHFISCKSGQNPVKLVAPFYFDYIGAKEFPGYISEYTKKISKIKYSSLKDFIVDTSTIRLTVGMFD